MDNWNSFKDPRFSLQFNYPSQGSDGEGVDVVETQQDGVLRAHVLTPKSREIYFEVTQYDALPALFEYQRHRENLLKQFDSFTISALIESVCASLPAYEYSFEWHHGRRVVLLVERGAWTYRLLYNPQAAVNMQILSTVRWLSQA